MGKVYVLSKRKDAELEQAIHNMDAYHLRIALYGVARGWQFDEAVSIAEEAAQQSFTPDALPCEEEKCDKPAVLFYCEDHAPYRAQVNTTVRRHAEKDKHG